MKKAAILLSIGFIMLGLPYVEVNAASTAAFTVQTAEVKSDGSMLTRIYLNDVTSLGGADVTVSYDPSKASYLGGWYGTGFDSQLEDMYHDASDGTIHCIALFAEANDSSGAFIEMTFQTADGSSYQPTLTVNKVVDGSDELNVLGSTVKYQQAAGAITAAPDTSGTVAKASVIEKALSDYGSAADVSEAAALSSYASFADGEAGAGTYYSADGETSRGNTDSLTIVEKPVGSGSETADNTAGATGTESAEAASNSSSSESSSGSKADATTDSSSKTESGGTTDGSSKTESGGTTDGSAKTEDGGTSGADGSDAEPKEDESAIDATDEAVTTAGISASQIIIDVIICLILVGAGVGGFYLWRLRRK